eukprot:TRINITY_DN253_c1_g2_i1.p1 TRINITY_DN253_c1_g2~~TRINITY_DN253_c1_g2_i1.p1  ORF type:complete len:932 (+),score=198.60 TRINITY_DN253_c1_g2_i1:121-2796(+)
MLERLRCLSAFGIGDADPGRGGSPVGSAHGSAWTRDWGRNRNSDLSGSSADGEVPSPRDCAAARAWVGRSGRAERALRVVVVGAPASGKSAVIARYVSGVYNRRHEPTVGPDLSVCQLPRRVLGMLSSLPRHPVRVQFVELPACELHRRSPRLLDDADCALVVADATQPRSIGIADQWLLRLRRKARSGIPLALLVNKSDAKRRVASLSSTGLEQYAEDADLVRACWTSCHRPASVLQPLDQLLAATLRRLAQQAADAAPGHSPAPPRFAFPHTVARSPDAADAVLVLRRMSPQPISEPLRGSVISAGGWQPPRRRPSSSAALSYIGGGKRDDSPQSTITGGDTAATRAARAAFSEEYRGTPLGNAPGPETIGPAEQQRSPPASTVPPAAGQDGALPPPRTTECEPIRADDDRVRACIQAVGAWHQTLAQVIGEYRGPFRLQLAALAKERGARDAVATLPQPHNQARHEVAAALDVELIREHERLLSVLRRLLAQVRQQQHQQHQQAQLYNRFSSQATRGAPHPTADPVRDSATDRELMHVFGYFCCHVVPGWERCAKQLRLEHMLAQARGSARHRGGPSGLVLSAATAGLQRSALVAPPACITGFRGRQQRREHEEVPSTAIPIIASGVDAGAGVIPTSLGLLQGSSAGSDAAPLALAFGVSAASSSHPAGGACATYPSFAEDAATSSPAADNTLRDDSWDCGIAPANAKALRPLSLAGADAIGVSESEPPSVLGDRLHTPVTAEAQTGVTPQVTPTAPAPQERNVMLSGGGFSQTRPRLYDGAPRVDREFVIALSGALRTDLRFLADYIGNSHLGRERGHVRPHKSPQLAAHRAPGAPAAAHLRVRSLDLPLSQGRAHKGMRQAGAVPPDSARSRGTDQRTPRFVEPSR